MAKRRIYDQHRPSPAVDRMSELARRGFRQNRNDNGSVDVGRNRRHAILSFMDKPNNKVAARALTSIKLFGCGFAKTDFLIL